MLMPDTLEIQEKRMFDQDNDNFNEELLLKYLYGVYS